MLLNFSFIFGIHYRGAKCCSAFPNFCDGVVGVMKKEKLVREEKKTAGQDASLVERAERFRT